MKKAIQELVLTLPSISPTTNKVIQSIRVTEETFDQWGLSEGQKRGFFNVDPAHADKALAAVVAGKVKLAFGQKIRNSTLYEIVRINVEQPDEAAQDEQSEVLAASAK